MPLARSLPAAQGDRRRPHDFRSAILGALLVWLIPAVARTQQYSAEAVETHRQGIEAFERGDIDEAIRLFRESYEVYHGHPYALFNLGECYERLGDLAQAVDYFERYIAASSDATEDRETVLERIRNLRARPAVLSLASTPPGATVAVCDPDGNSLADFPLATTPAEIELPPGTFVLRFELPGVPPQTRVVQGGLGRRTTVDVVFAGIDGSPVGPVEPGTEVAPPPPVLVGLQGGVVAALQGARNIFATGGAGAFAGYEFPGGAWRFVLGGDFWLGFYPIEIRQTGVRHGSYFLDFAAVPGLSWRPMPALRLVGSVGVGVGVYLPPGDPAVPVPWVGAPIDGPMVFLHLRPAVLLEWLFTDTFGLFVVPVAVDIDVALGTGIHDRLLVNYAALGGATMHF